MFKQLFEFAQQQPDGRLPIPVQMICDDFATGCKVQGFQEYISIFREALISVMLLIQSQSQLSAIYGKDDATTIINNCDTMVYTGSMDLKTNKNISERLNVPLDEVLYMPLSQVLIFRRGQRPIVTKRYEILQGHRYQEVERIYRSRISSEQRNGSQLQSSANQAV